MGAIDTFKRSRVVQLGIVAITLFVLFFFFRSSPDYYSPEDLNSLLQNKDESTVKVRKIELKEQGLHKPFLESGSYHIKNWDIAGNVIVKSNELIRLVSDNQHHAGSIFNQVPIQDESFEMELTFHIHSKNSKNLVADGLAIWFLDQKSEIGDVFGAKNYFNGMGIFIDTYKNGKKGNFPYVNVMLGDGKTAYNKDTDGFETRLAGCSARNLLNPKSGMTKARIVYTKYGYFSLDFKYTQGPEGWINCVTAMDVKLPEKKYLGFSAETGDLSHNVDILENKIYALYKPDGVPIGSLQELERLMQEQSEMKEEEKRGGGRHRVFKKKPTKQQRRSLRRLKNSEKRIKERERKLREEKYGNPDYHLGLWILDWILHFLKMIVYIVAISAFLWLGRIFYRTYTLKRKSKVTGLLD